MPSPENPCPSRKPDASQSSPTTPEATTRSYVPYLGGKDQVAARINTIMPDEGRRTRIEAFFGAGSLFFGADKAKVNVLNDLDPDVMNMHETVAANPEAVMAELHRLPISRRLYDEIQEQQETGAWLGLTNTERAARQIYQLCCAFNANVRSPFPAASTEPIKFNPNMDLRPAAAKLAGVTFESMPYDELIDRYVLQQAHLNCLLICDPPYMVATRNAYYRFRFTILDHVRLARKLAQVNEHNGESRSVKIILTYDDDPLIRALYRRQLGWTTSPLPIRYAGGHHDTATTELLITNFALEATA
jgi:DNA adenine methylase